ncbi:MAG: hypothetical protein RL662_2254 [Bacteroidota bacterium]|jgi:NADPH:quinone reductase-like Zn-dependent oxidoreductase
MIAQSWCWQRKGEPSDLVLKEKRLRPLADNEVLIQNTVIGLNPVDWKLIEWGHPAWKADLVPGVDGMGVVVAVGENMTHLRVGTRVCYHTDLSKDGSFSTHTFVNGFALMVVPEHVSDEVAASFPCPALTAWQAFDKIPNVAGKNVLVSGAGGSVGYILTQFLLKANAKVHVTASDKHHADFLSKGVIKTVDYRQKDWTENMLESLNGNRFDVVFDTLSGEHASKLMPMLGYYGHLVTIQDRLNTNPLAAFTTCVSLHEIALGAIHQYGSVLQIVKLMQDGEKLLQQIGNGTLTLRQNLVNSFDNLPQHLSEMKQNHCSTKYLIKV